MVMDQPELPKGVVRGSAGWACTGQVEACDMPRRTAVALSDLFLWPAFPGIYPP